MQLNNYFYDSHEVHESQRKSLTKDWVVEVDRKKDDTMEFDPSRYPRREQVRNDSLMTKLKNRGQRRGTNKRPER
jgi:hypothetical protein